MPWTLKQSSSAMPTWSSKLVLPLTVHKSAWEKENGLQNNCKMLDFEAELSESEALPEVERATTKKGNPKPMGNLKGRKKNAKGRGDASGKSKKKAPDNEVEEDLHVADLTTELKDLSN